MGTGLPDRLSPFMGQQFTESFDRMVGDAAENIAEPGKRIDLHQFAACDEAAQNRRGPATVIAPEESPVVPSDREATQRPLGTVVVDGEIAVAAITCERRPVLQRIGNRLSRLALRQYLLADHQQVLMDLHEHGPGVLLPRTSQRNPCCRATFSTPYRCAIIASTPPRRAGSFSSAL